MNQTRELPTGIQSFEVLRTDGYLYVDLLKESDYDLRKLVDGIEVQSSDFTEYRADKMNPVPMIYQSGYLTIKGYDKKYEMYTL